MNKNSMILANIGSGSSYLPDIAEMLIERRDTLKVAEWRLMDIDEYRLNCTGKYVQKMFAEAGMPTKITLTLDLDEAVKDADFVITTIRPGMSDGRNMDETIPFKHGLIGQETTAPGGMIMGFKTIPAMLKIAKAIENHAQKSCYLINLANPSGMIGEALERHSNIHYACLCNGPTVIRTAMKAIYGQENPNDVFVEVIGLNHLIWCKVFVKGADVTDEAFEKLLEWSAEHIPALRREFVEPALEKFIGYIPMGPYLEFYYDYDTNYNDLQNYSGNHWEMMVNHVRKHVGDVLDDLQAPEHATRAECVKIIEKRTFELYEKLDPRAYQLACNTRGGKGYGEAGVTLMNALWNNTNEVFSPDVASMGFDTPTYELSLKTADTEWTLTVGSKNSITNNWYARLSADGPVYTLDSSALSGICKTAKQLYAAQSITDIDVDDVTKMVVQTANGGTLSFAQNDGTWTLTDDAEYNLDQDIVKKMASTICDLKTKWSVTEPQADAVYGLDTPNAIVTLIASDGTSIQCSFGGNDAEDDTLCYLRSSGAAGVVYEVSTDALNAFAYDKAALEAEEEATPETADVAAEDPVGNDNTVDDE